MSPEPQPDAGRKAVAPATEDQGEGEVAQQEEAEVAATSEEAEATEELTPLQSLKDLAERYELDPDSLMDLDLPTKIDGKEGKARLRDVLKSYQLESHLNNKLMAFADEKKAFETERQTHAQQRQERIQQIDTAAKVAQRLLDGEFANVNFQELQNSDPNAFNAKVLEYQHRKQAIQFLVDQIGQESKTADEAAANQGKAYLAEQSKLLDAKLPEWADSAKRTKDVADMATVLADAYGISEQELRGVADHRQLLIARDAWQWQKLQKAKPALLNKVRDAPKLVKPGTPSSKGAQDSLARKQAQDRLRASGKVGDAKGVLKHLLFS